MSFTEKVALVTGAASGIGAATAAALARAGAHLALVDLTAPSHPPAGALLLRQDVSDEEAWAAAERTIRDHFGGLDFAVINAGIADGGPIADLDFARWRRVMSVNLDGAFLSLRAALRLVREGGAIVLTSSISGIKAEPGTAAYGASKAAVIQLARVAAKEGAPRRVRVNAIAPGGVDTPIWDAQPWFADMVAQHGGDRAAALAALAGAATPLGAYATADEIAQQIVFLLGPGAASITGAVLTADGGYSL